MCGRTFVPKTGSHRFCTPVCRERSRFRPGHAVKYGAAHRRARALLVNDVERGVATCSRCGLPILIGEPWDLDHADNGDGYRGVSHSSCNRLVGARKATRQTSYRDDSRCQDDPDRGIFWGPGETEDSPPRSWSRAWFEWRYDGFVY
jgi:hypothetical protein